MRLLATEGKRFIECEEKGSGFYDGIYSKERVYSVPACESPNYPIYEKVVKKISDTERVLDLGCGTGQFAQVLLNHGKKFVMGVDFSPVAIKKAQSMLPHCLFKEADLYRSVPYGIVHYECATLIEVMEHLEHDLVVLGHIHEGTHVIFTVPNYITEEGSHVRGFLSEKDITDRYGKLIEIMGIEEVKMGTTQKLFIVDSIRRDA